MVSFRPQRACSLNPSTQTFLHTEIWVEFSENSHKLNATFLHRKFWNFTIKYSAVYFHTRPEHFRTLFLVISTKKYIPRISRSSHFSFLRASKSNKVISVIYCMANFRGARKHWIFFPSQPNLYAESCAAFFKTETFPRHGGHETVKLGL